ncbi:NlpC/P60 family protein [Dongia deserti]|uniref:NlpC/P60 family protein n=1 Tax=Dongia deserti TaxID=2268030 RepID=UPI0013C3E520|nr:TIGR02594 family protein [Dongia deserti]
MAPEMNGSLWFSKAREELGVTEIPGDMDNPRIIEYHSATSLKAPDDETPWCSAFVNWCFQQVGIKGTNLANARSWQTWGQELAEPRLGCVVVLWRENRNSPKGHVAFYVGPDDANPQKIRLLGGNQGDRVSIAGYDKSRVLSYRWPPAA